MKRSDRWRPLFGGAATAVVCLGVTLSLGARGDAEALRLVESIVPTLRFLASSLITACATILALMLTVLGLSLDSDKQLVEDHYERVRQIALWTTIGFLASLFFLLVLTVPLFESDKVPSSWYSVIYYAFLSFASLLAGYVSSVVLMLYDTLSDMIEAVGLDRDDHPLVDGEARREGTPAG